MRFPIIRPAPIDFGQTIGIFTPSTPANVIYRDKYLHGLDVLRRLGFRVIEGSLTRRAVAQGYRSGTPRERAAELMELVLDPDVHCIMSCTGGYNSSSLIPYLDFDAIRANPKIICGYSDITSLHMAILTLAGLSTFYGPAAAFSFGEWPDVLPETRDSFLDAVMRHRAGRRALVPPARWSNHRRPANTDAWRTVEREYEPSPGWRALNAGEASAPIVAANLNTLLSAAGTVYFPDLTGCILMIEEMAAPMNVEERSFRHLERLGVFDRIAGLILGKPEFHDPSEAPFSYDELLMEVVGPDRAYPIVSNFDCGHTHPMLTIAQMTLVTLAARDGYDVTVTIDEPMVSTEGRNSE